DAASTHLQGRGRARPRARLRDVRPRRVIARRRPGPRPDSRRCQDRRRALRIHRCARSSVRIRGRSGPVLRAGPVRRRRPGAAGAHAVRSGQADAFLYDDVAVLALARRDPALRVTGAPIRPRAYVAAARKEDTGLIRWVNGWLAKMRRDGTYRCLWRRYFTPF